MEHSGCSWINPGCANGNMASSYAPWLCAWYKAIKAVAPNTVLSVGGLDYNPGVTKGKKERKIEERERERERERK